MKKFILSALIFLGFLISIPQASALQDAYYKNPNGVILTKEEYEFLSLMYWDGYQSIMTLSDYTEFKNSNIMSGDITSKTSEDGIKPRGTFHETNAKILKITSSCSSDCFVSVVLTWKNNPNTRSYDVMGARFNNTTVEPSTIRTRITSTNGQLSFNDIKSFNNGFGVSMALPKSGSNIVAYQTYTVTKGGTVYASYQHAKSTISLANSKNYTISPYGYGGVFQFSGVAANVYDRMNGVSIDI